ARGGRGVHRAGRDQHRALRAEADVARREEAPRGPLPRRADGRGGPRGARRGRAPVRGREGRRGAAARSTTDMTTPPVDPETGTVRASDRIVLLPTLHQTLEFAVLA